MLSHGQRLQGNGGNENRVSLSFKNLIFSTIVVYFITHKGRSIQHFTHKIHEVEYIVERENEQGETGLSYSMNRFKTPENLCGKDTQENDHRGLGPNT